MRNDEKTATRVTGNRGEELTCIRLLERGMRIVDRNVREKFAEIDIVAMDGDTLCFVEVRTRKNTLLGHPSETVTLQKQRSVRRAAEAYLARRNIINCPVRFDVATIVWDTEEYMYFKNAF